MDIAEDIGKLQAAVERHVPPMSEGIPVPAAACVALQATTIMDCYDALQSYMDYIHDGARHALDHADVYALYLRVLDWRGCCESISRAMGNGDLRTHRRT